METQNINSEHSKNWYDKYYKLMLFLPLVVLLISLIYIGFFFRQHGDIMLKDVSLSGGTTITLIQEIDAVKLELALKEKFPDIIVRKISDLSSGKTIATTLESSATPEVLKQELETFLGKTLPDEQISIEFTGASLSSSFYKQLIIALAISFLLMSIVIFILFRTFIPSLAVIFAAFSDIVMPLALIDFLGIKLSAAGISAFLMLIGYSVDTDILLTTRVLKGEGNVNHNIYRAFKTGIFMTLTALAAVLPSFFLFTSLPESFRQIFFVLALGLLADIMNTWLTNASIIKWYAEKKGGS